jgi:hypothetical protein
MGSSTDTAGLRASLAAHNAAFSALLALIPARYYLTPDAPEEPVRPCPTAETPAMLTHRRAGTTSTRRCAHPVRRRRASRPSGTRCASLGSRGVLLLTRPWKLDPANQKTILELTAASSSKTKADDLADDLALDSDADADADAPLTPMPGIADLRARLAARMRRGPGGPAAAQGRDALLEERRAQRGAMRERRRKETREKIRRQVEARGKGARTPAPGAVKGPTTKVTLTGSCSLSTR